MVISKARMFTAISFFLILSAEKERSALCLDGCSWGTGIVDLILRTERPDYFT
jgi:hypothetical protein